MINNLIEIAHELYSNKEFKDVHYPFSDNTLLLAVQIQRNYLIDNLIKEVEGVKIVVNMGLDQLSDEVFDNTTAIEGLTNKISDTITALNT